MNRGLIVVISILLSMCLWGNQNHHYYYYNDKIDLMISRQEFVVQIPQQNKSDFINSFNTTSNMRIVRTLNQERNIYYIKSDYNTIDRDIYNINTAFDALRTFPTYYKINENGDTSMFIMSDEFRVSFKPNIEKILLRN